MPTGQYQLAQRGKLSRGLSFLAWHSLNHRSDPSGDGSVNGSAGLASLLAVPFKQRFRQHARVALCSPFGRVVVRKLTRSALAPADMWRRLPCPEEIIVDVDDGHAFHFRSGDTSGGRMVHWRGNRGYEAATLGPFMEVARASSVIADVGANVGLYTTAALAANRRARITAFEPVTRSADKVEENAEINGWRHRLDLRRMAVGSEPGSAELHIPGGNYPAAASLVAGYRGTVREIQTVEVTTLDRAIDGRLDLVKIDVEGFELQVLAGAERHLASSRPAVFFECNPEGPAHELTAVFRDHGYTIHALTFAGRHPVDRVVPDSSERFRNFLATP